MTAAAISLFELLVPEGFPRRMATESAPAGGTLRVGFDI